MVRCRDPARPALYPLKRVRDPPPGSIDLQREHVNEPTARLLDLWLPGLLPSRSGSNSFRRPFLPKTHQTHSSWSCGVVRGRALERFILGGPERNILTFQAFVLTAAAWLHSHELRVTLILILNQEFRLSYAGLP